jgi:hypothetical protein
MVKILKQVYSKLTFWDMGLLKIYGALFGVLVGWYFYEQISSLIPFVLGSFIILMVRFLYVIFIKQ